MIYLDNAATTFPKPPAVIRAVADCMENRGGNPGRGGHMLSRLCSESVFLCRENLAALIGCKNPERIIFTKNTTEALNTAIKGVLRSGDEVIISSMEHNSVLRSVVAMEKRGVTVKIARADLSGRVSPEAYAALITPSTRLICVIHASNICGTVNPVEDICRMAREKGILTLVDCAQTGGVIPINAEHFDMAAFAGHKGLYGPFGTGALYIRDGLELETLTEGGTGSMSESALMPSELPDRFEAGTLNACGIAGLNEGIKFVMREGIHEKEMLLTQRLTDNLKNISGLRILGESGVGVVGIAFSQKDCVEVATRLDSEYSIAARAGLHCSPMAHRTLGTFSSGMLRLSVGWFNTQKDVDTAAYAISRILSS